MKPICPKCSQTMAGPFLRITAQGERLRYLCPCGHQELHRCHDDRQADLPAAWVREALGRSRAKGTP